MTFHPIPRSCLARALSLSAVVVLGSIVSFVHLLGGGDHRAPGCRASSASSSPARQVTGPQGLRQRVEPRPEQADIGTHVGGRSLPLAGSDAERALANALAESLGAAVQVRWDRRRGLVPRSIRIVGARRTFDSPFEAARSVLLRTLDALGDSTWSVVAEGSVVPAAGRVLVGAKTVATPGGAIETFTAFLDGIPVDAGDVKVELRCDRPGIVPLSMVGNLLPGAHLVGAVSPAIEAQIAARYTPVRARRFEARPTWRLVAHASASGSHRRAFEVTAPMDGAGARRDVIDAERGDVLDSYPIACTGTAEVLTWETDPDGARRRVPLGGLFVKKGRKRVVTDDAGTFALTGTVTIDRGFEGPLVRILPDGPPAFTYSGPADFTLLSGASGEESVHQDEAAAFHYVMTYNAAMQAAHAELADAAHVRFPVIVASDLANAFFSPTPITTDDGESFSGYVDLGTMDDRSLARDGSVVEHEYTHALLNGVAYLYGTNEAQGVNEGLADYFPCELAENPRIGAWARPPYVRALDNKPKKLVWPRDAESEDMEVHRIGNIFNQALWEARMKASRQDQEDRLRIDQAVFGGVLRMPQTPSLADACEAILAADEALNGGAHVTMLEAAFADHGLEVASEPADAGSADASGADVAFSQPTRSSFVVHVGDAVAIPVEATSVSGARIELASSALAHARLESDGGGSGSGTLLYDPVDEDRGRHSITLTASTSAESVTKTITVVVRRHRS